MGKAKGGVASDPWLENAAPPLMRRRSIVLLGCVGAPAALVAGFVIVALFIFSTLTLGDCDIDFDIDFDIGNVDRLVINDGRAGPSPGLLTALQRSGFFPDQPTPHELTCGDTACPINPGLEVRQNVADVSTATAAALGSGSIVLNKNFSSLMGVWLCDSKTEPTSVPPKCPNPTPPTAATWWDSQCRATTIPVVLVDDAPAGAMIVLTTTLEPVYDNITVWSAVDAQRPKTGPLSPEEAAKALVPYAAEFDMPWGASVRRALRDLQDTKDPPSTVVPPPSAPCTR